LLDDADSIVEGLKHLRFRGNDVIVFQVLDPHELTFPFSASSRFTDLESAETIIADPARIRHDYLAELGRLQARYERDLRSAGIDYVRLDSSKPLDFALLTYLAARSRRK
jgi:uncharacterized protein (DUF58 family)